MFPINVLFTPDTFGIIFLRFMQVKATPSTSLLSMVDYFLIVWFYYKLFILSPVDGDFDYPHFLKVVYNAILRTYVQVF